MKRIAGSAILAAFCVAVIGPALAADKKQEGQTNPPVPATAFVQGRVVIVPPIRHAQIQPGLDDGGTIRATLTDARGKKFVIYIDHRISSKTPGDVYLYADPDEKNSVHVINQREFRAKIGDFDKGPSSSF